MWAEFNRPVTLKRPVFGGYYVGGVWHEHSPITVVVNTSLQPSKPQELQLLPEGRRVTGQYTLYAEEEIRIGDRLEIGGAPYEILHVEVWQNLLPHYKAIAVKSQQEQVT